MTAGSIVQFRIIAIGVGIRPLPPSALGSWNTVMLPVGPADIRSAVVLLSGLQARWPHRLQVCVPVLQSVAPRAI